VSTRVRLQSFQRCDIEQGEFVRVRLPAGDILVGRVEGRLKAYWNVCPHRLVPLDLGGLPPRSDDGKYLLCHQHGALFRPEDGVCIEGPCAGEGLREVKILADGEDVMVDDVGEPPGPGA
jgi:nitrite reductase/ring-hydroxylating ferredoxin subunit